MLINNNPLKQYFRRPAIYITLPSTGTSYTESVINMPESGELPVYPMTAIDEITTKTPDALFNGTAIVELIKSCVPNIIDPWKITSNDLDAILIAIRSASQGNELEIESQCTSCKELATYGVNLVGILSTLKSGDYNKEFIVNDLSIKFRPLTYKEMNDANIGQFQIQKLFSELEKLESDEDRAKKTQEALKAITEVTMNILSKTIEYIATPGARVTETEYILDFLKNCDKQSYVSIRNNHNELKSQSELKPLKIKCIHCNHEYEQAFAMNPADFFA